MESLMTKAARAASNAHRIVFDSTKGRVLGGIPGTKVVRLTTIGRKSGQPRVTMLSTPIPVGDRVILIASFGGEPRHPQWYRNLCAEPRVTVNISGIDREMIARTADPSERAQLWPRIVCRSPNYGFYQLRTSREIPVVILENATAI
ncbi:nitroreductase family deazaflavin-dependent oxidoreductase [Nocardia yunnanensis]|uniref:Nitroreductase family deazaflavin-dependent oxidoreductase n=1 Tax=Nocardia yunnanensis TaxID=2382165 RepID=A0A386ZCZ7_9NOCA|nr:nitroreductase family deazaflavin-dependent oxidoreductase [Nocardia yunnanensis]AYF75386.1 nitroreductase family deazaflavin-dependent oxidoreductase [Nocardia yunnanensis]